MSRCPWKRIVKTGVGGGSAAVGRGGGVEYVFSRTGVDVVVTALALGDADRKLSSIGSSASSSAASGMTASLVGGSEMLSLKEMLSRSEIEVVDKRLFIRILSG